VQWTRLPGRADTDAFVEHVRRLMSPEATDPATARLPPWGLPSSATVAAPPRSTRATSRSFLPWIVIGLLILGTGYFVVDKFPLSRRAVPAGEAVGIFTINDSSASRGQAMAAIGFADEIPVCARPIDPSSFTSKGTCD
jgi:hypothetical protein